MPLSGHDVPGQLSHTLIQVIMADQEVPILRLVHLFLQFCDKVLRNLRLYNGEAFLHDLVRETGTQRILGIFFIYDILMSKLHILLDISLAN